MCYQELKNLTEAIARTPENIDLYKKRASLYRGYLQDYQKAIDDYTKIIELEPNNPFNYKDRYIESFYLYENGIIQGKGFIFVKEVVEKDDIFFVVGKYHFKNIEEDIEIPIDTIENYKVMCDNIG